jgi:hypothetical protein
MPYQPATNHSRPRQMAGPISANESATFLTVFFVFTALR